MSADYAKRRAVLLESPCASYWLQTAIRSMELRDVCDAAADAELLADLMRQRRDETLRRFQASRVVPGPAVLS